MFLKLDALQKFAEHLPDGILVIDSNGSIVVYNNEAFELLGINIEDILFKPIEEIVDCSELVSAIKNSSEHKNQRFNCKYRDRYLHCGIRSAENLSAEGCWTIVSISDSSASMRLEQIKKEFISAILHKIRSPLATLKTTLSVLHEYESEKMASDALDLLNTSEHEVDRLSSLLNSLRDLFIIEAGLVDAGLMFEKILVSKSLKKVEKALTLIDRDCMSRIRIQGADNAYIYADFEKITRVMELILGNALVFSKDIINVTIDYREKFYDIKITDLGIGISEECMSNIFTKYYREDNAITRAVQGNGLGLFIARAWLDAMGGSISLESIKDQGTIVTLSVPAIEGFC